MDKNLMFNLVQSTPPDYYQEPWQKKLQLITLRFFSGTNLVMDSLGGLIREGVRDLIEMDSVLGRLTREKNRRKKIETGKTVTFSCFNEEKSLIMGAPEPEKDFFEYPADLFVFCRVTSVQKKKLLQKGYGEIFQFGSGAKKVHFFIRKEHWSIEFFPEKGGLKGLVVDKKPLDYVLQRIWGFPGLKPDQFSIIKKILKRKQVLGILPTGAGKSICFQLPALLFPGTSIIVAPLKSLIRDQIENLHSKERGLWADFLDSSQDTNIKNRVLQRWWQGQLKLLYLSPERLQQKRIRDLIRQRGFSRQGFFILDEIHCVSEWGHDFRPAYLKIATDFSDKKGSGLIGLTATAPARVRNELKERFQFKEEDIFATQKMDRAEVGLQVELVSPGQNRKEVLKKIIKEHLPSFFGYTEEEIREKTSGLIFTPYARAEGNNTREASTEKLKLHLEENGHDVFSYHGNLEEREKKKIQDDFIRNKIPLLVATRAFGMGIDKPDINYVIHYYSPGSLEAYFQEMGRVGRNGERSLAILLFKPRKKKCLQETRKRGKMEPPCTGNWKCRYRVEELCDFGVQAQFIKNQHQSPQNHASALNYLIREIFRRGGKEIGLKIEKRNQVLFQKYLNYLQGRGVILDYYIQYYEKEGLTLGIEKETTRLQEPGEVLTAGFIQRDYKIKRRKFAALEMVEKYALEKERCRRVILLDYMDQQVDFKGRCGYCDRESLKASGARSIEAKNPSEKGKNRLQLLLGEKDFSAEEVVEILEMAEKKGEVEKLKRLAEEKLKEQPENEVALFFVGMVELKKDGKLERILTCTKELQKKRDHTGVREILSQIIFYEEKLALSLVKQLKNRSNIAGCCFLMGDKINRQKFNLLCLENWAEELGNVLGGEKTG